MFSIAKMNDSGEWEILREFMTLEEADNHVDTYSDKYPFAWVDILDSKGNLAI